ncbi:bifunctional helix-turn-helix transcriptional regulator/GNAT family N-acetyltransferase [Streptomyces griseorubiginosus]|uniref:bifunctional helix-turn-helix transcriptional regulator/GNAT family N-acetyltransferase n=1 Tax=Streptomyces griseorubiginosus TaxID=67304 RepID=UPI002E80E46B|nr:bifunctional helix-turn-helix transcriptional regulator/GNAT family N-acetyltransferase [Streptomyces griseorubiginosus]WUB46913.1 bifunctional helix-turn-helix transcriptional regulator/GNAT family N-acetyltransferase [Streptomyces griseorubiginosus]WUB55435.1 bifunctional helix-turn-helix transcriptional regulator/GNAT family N-acetyltransferase [Streptomyces griseorubiginosus]
MTVQDIRAFNRFYTNVIGALDYSRQLYAPYTLTESRVLYELAHSPRTDAADLRGELSLDAGYLSRILNKFERAGLIERTASRKDPRRVRVTLTPRGRETAALLAERADESVGALLATVPAAERPRLSEAMHTVRTLLSDGRPPRREDVLLREPRPGDLGWMVARNAALYAAEYGFNADYEGLVARIVADFAEDHDPHLERVWIAESDGRPVGCVMCVRDEAPATARLRLLLVEPDARGLGIGDRLVSAVVDFARGVGYRDLVLWTNDVLTSARRLYQRHGFVLTAEKPHRSFGQDLNGQDWHLDLTEPTGAGG